MFVLLNHHIVFYKRFDLGLTWWKCSQFPKGESVTRNQWSGKYQTISTLLIRANRREFVRSRNNRFHQRKKTPEGVLFLFRNYLKMVFI